MFKVQSSQGLLNTLLSVWDFASGCTGVDLGTCLEVQTTSNKSLSPDLSEFPGICKVGKALGRVSVGLGRIGRCRVPAAVRSAAAPHFCSRYAYNQLWTYFLLYAGAWKWNWDRERWDAVHEQSVSSAPIRGVGGRSDL